MPMEKLSERIIFMPPDPAYDRPMLGYIKGDRFSIAIDAGSSEEHIRLFYRELGKEQLPLPELTILTHSHWDHSFALAYINGLSLANEKTCSHLQAIAKTDPEELFRSYISEDYSFLRKEYKNPDSLDIRVPDISFRKSLSIDAGGITLSLMHVISPHTDDSTLILIPSEKILFIGDASSGEILSDADLESGGRYRKEELSSFIKTLRKLDATTIVHSHWQPVPAEEEISYLEGILAEF